MKKYIAFSVGMMLALIAIILAEAKTGIHTSSNVSMAMLIAGICSDMLSTYLCFKHGGREQNPAAAWLIKKITIFGLFGVFACIWGAFFWFSFRHSNIYAQSALAIVYWSVPINNMWVLRRLMKAQKSTQIV